MNEAFVVLEPASAIPPYVQIVEQLRAAIEQGVLSSGDQLPTVRQLAGDLAVAPNTVARAYQILQDDGWVTGDRRRGTRIAAAPPLPRRRELQTRLKEAARQFASLHRSLGFSESDIMEAVHKALAS